MPGVCGIKAFLGSSTGTLLLNKEEDILAALKAGKRRVAVHSEDEDRMIARKHLAERGNDLLEWETLARLNVEAGERIQFQDASDTRQFYRVKTEAAQ